MGHTNPNPHYFSEATQILQAPHQATISWEPPVEILPLRSPPSGQWGSLHLQACKSFSTQSAGLAPGSIFAAGLTASVKLHRSPALSPMVIPGLTARLWIEWDHDVPLFEQIQYTQNTGLKLTMQPCVGSLDVPTLSSLQGLPLFFFSVETFILY